TTYHYLPSALNCSLHDPHSFPTRRSSDLTLLHLSDLVFQSPHHRGMSLRQRGHRGDRTEPGGRRFNPLIIGACRCDKRRPRFLRSEEHTSELQSRFDLVCRLLLEKKK